MNMSCVYMDHLAVIFLEGYRFIVYEIGTECHESGIML